MKRKFAILLSAMLLMQAVCGCGGANRNDEVQHERVMDCAGKQFPNEYQRHRIRGEHAF